MFYLPLYHNLSGARCMVIGAGTTAVRKIRWLLRADAHIEVIAPEISPAIQTLASSGKLTVRKTVFASEQVSSELRLIISATNNRAVNTQVYEAATRAGVLVNCVDQPDLCTFIFPAIVDRSPILIAISSMGNAPTLSRVVRGWIEAQLSPNLGKLASLARSLRERVKAELPSVDARKEFWETLFRSSAAESAMQGDLQDARRKADAMLTAHRARQTDHVAQATVALVGAGPGDPELITLKALRLIQSADVILYDKLANPAILDYARRDAEFEFVGKQGPKPGSPPTRPDNRGNQQFNINDRIIEHARAGKNVVRLKGGDPFIYGRGGEEMEQVLDAGFDVVMVPGITAALGAASYAGIPLTYRNLSQSVRFVTGHRVENVVNLDWPEMGRRDQTLVIYMGLVGLPLILEKLMEHGCEHNRPAALVENATLPDQRVIMGTVATLADAAHEAQISGPSVVIIGDVVAKRRV
ncbi:MAG: siroheme synthase CysG [bacterium]